MMPQREFDIQPSKYYFFLYSLIFLFSVLIILGLPLSLDLKIIMLGLTLAYGAYGLWGRVLLHSRSALRQLKWLNEEDWQIKTAKRLYFAKLKNSTVTAHVMVLRFQVKGHLWPRSCVIFNDALDKAAYRSLLMLLKQFR